MALYILFVSTLACFHSAVPLRSIPSRRATRSQPAIAARSSSYAARPRRPRGRWPRCTSSEALTGSDATRGKIDSQRTRWSMSVADTLLRLPSSLVAISLQRREFAREKAWK